MARTTLRWLSVLALALSVVACGDDDGDAMTTDAGPDATTPPVPPPGDSGADPDAGDDDATTPTPPPPPPGCVSLRGSAALLDGFVRGTGASSAESMVPAGDAIESAPTQSFGAFEESTPLPHGVHDSAGWYFDGWLYTLGGQDDGPTNLDTLYAAPLDPTGVLGAWQAGTSFPILILDHSVRVHGGRAYLTGGGQCDDRGVCRQQTASYVADPRDGDVTEWIAQPENPHRRMGHDTVIASGFLYTIGGDDGDVSTEDVSFAPILPDGSLGAWRMTTPTPEGGLQFLAAAATSRHVYIVGGCRRKDCFQTRNIEDRVFVADVGDDGALGEWRVAATLPVRTFDPGVTIHGGRLVVSGGRPGGFGRCGDFGGDESDEVWYADIAPDGSLGTWTGGRAEGGVMPRPRSDHNVIVVFHEPFDASGDVWMWGGRTSCIEGEDRSWDLEYPPSVWRAPLVEGAGVARFASWTSGAITPESGAPTGVRIDGDGTLSVRVRAFDGTTWSAWSARSTEREVAVSGGATIQVLVEAESDGTTPASIRGVDVDCE